MSLTADAVQKITDLARPVSASVNGKDFVLGGYSVVTEPKADILNCHTLTALTDYISANIDRLSTQEVILHILNSDSVILYSALKPVSREREMFIQATIFDSGFEFGKWYQVDEFIILLRSLFVRTEDTDYIMSLVAGLTQESSGTISDNGITQAVSVKSGISFVKTEAIKNPVVLKPYRTFLEIEQPDSVCLFRIKQGGDGKLPLCSLFEADGGQWRLEAISRIKAYLKEHAPGIAIVA